MKLQFQKPTGGAVAALLLMSAIVPLLLAEPGGAYGGACTPAEPCVLYYALGEWRVMSSTGFALADAGSRHVGYVRNEEDGSWTIYYAPSLCAAPM